MKSWFLIILSFFSFSNLFARSRNVDPENAWWTGSLLTGSAVVVPPKHYNLEPYLFINNSYGIYTHNWGFEKRPSFVGINPLINASFGIYENFDMQILPQAFLNSSSGKNDSHFGDLPVKIGYQLIKEKKKTWIPYVRLVLSETFPTGKYKNLEPLRLRTDLSGLGSFITTVGVNIQKSITLKNHHSIRLRGNFSYDMAAPVKVSGFNAYGGGLDAQGKIFPGNAFLSIFSLEYGITKNWVFSLDLVYLHTNKDRFKGNSGFLFDSFPSEVGLPASENISLAPAFEYNYDEHVGFIAGIWFSAAGRNSLAFFSPVLAWNFYY